MGSIEEGPQIEIPSGEYKDSSYYGANDEEKTDIKAIQMSDDYLNDFGILEENFHKVQGVD